jgi:glutamate synthase (NADPH/NADH) small chain
LRFGIPDFKLEKTIIDRRIALLEEEGIQFKTGAHVGVNIDAKEIKENHDAVVLCGGATVRRGLPIEGANLKGVVQAMDFLPQNNRRVSNLEINGETITAEGKDVIVIGGGDTGSDCIGTSRRQGANSIQNFEIMPMATKDRPENQPWPFWPMRLRESTSHKEGVERHFSIMTKRFLGNDKGELTGLETVEVSWEYKEGRMQLVEREGSSKTWDCNLALLALGFTGSENTLAESFGLTFDNRGNIAAEETDYKTNVSGVFAAGDQRRGQSLIVWAISEGRQAAHHVDKYLMGESHLPLKGDGDLPRV